MKTLWKGHANPWVGLGMILTAVCAALFFTACPLSESPDTNPDLSGYWFADNISVPGDPGSESRRRLAIIRNDSIQILAFVMGGDQVEGMRGTYTNNETTMTVQVAATYNQETKEWTDETSNDVITYTLENNVLTMDIPGPNGSPITVPFAKIAAPVRPTDWVGSWSGIYNNYSGVNIGDVTATLQADGSFNFIFNAMSFTQTGFWHVITYNNTYYLLNYITQEGSSPVDYYVLTMATLSSNNTHATIEGTFGVLELDKQPND